MFLTMREIWGWSLPLSLGAAGLVRHRRSGVRQRQYDEGVRRRLVPAGRRRHRVLPDDHLAARPHRSAARARTRHAIRCPTSSRRFTTKTRVPGTAVYMTSRLDVVPVPLLHNLKHNKVLHRAHRVAACRDRERAAHRAAAAHRDHPSWRQFSFRVRALRLHGTAEHSAGARSLPHLPARLRHDGYLLLCRPGDDRGRASARASARSDARVFETMHRNALPATEFFRIPPDRVIELGGQVEM